MLIPCPSVSESPLNPFAPLACECRRRTFHVVIETYYPSHVPLLLLRWPEQPCAVYLAQCWLHCLASQQACEHFLRPRTLGTSWKRRSFVYHFHECVRLCDVHLFLSDMILHQCYDKALILTLKEAVDGSRDKIVEAQSELEGVHDEKLGIVICAVLLDEGDAEEIESPRVMRTFRDAKGFGPAYVVHVDRASDLVLYLRLVYHSGRCDHVWSALVISTSNAMSVFDGGGRHGVVPTSRESRGAVVCFYGHPVFLRHHYVACAYFHAARYHGADVHGGCHPSQIRFWISSPAASY